MKHHAPKALYIECEATDNTKINTGIQRVVRRIMVELPVVSEKFNLRPVSVGFTGKGFHLKNIDF